MGLIHHVTGSYKIRNGLDSRVTDQNSSILNSTEKCNVAYLRNLLPRSAQTSSFRCVFSTRNDGWNLDILYRKTLNMSPTILLLRSLQQNVILGAYLSGNIKFGVLSSAQ